MRRLTMPRGSSLAAGRNFCQKRTADLTGIGPRLGPPVVAEMSEACAFCPYFACRSLHPSHPLGLGA